MGAKPAGSRSGPGPLWACGLGRKSPAPCCPASTPSDPEPSSSPVAPTDPRWTPGPAVEMQFIFCRTLSCIRLRPPHTAEHSAAHTFVSQNPQGPAAAGGPRGRPALSPREWRGARRAGRRPCDRGCGWGCPEAPALGDGRGEGQRDLLPPGSLGAGPAALGADPQPHQNPSHPLPLST